MHLIAVCEKPDAETETRFYECSNPVCRESFRACVPVLREQGWIGLKRDLARERAQDPAEANIDEQ